MLFLPGKPRLFNSGSWQEGREVTESLPLGLRFPSLVPGSCQQGSLRGWVMTSRSLEQPWSVVPAGPGSGGVHSEESQQLWLTMEASSRDAGGVTYKTRPWARLGCGLPTLDVDYHPNTWVSQSLDSSYDGLVLTLPLTFMPMVIPSHCQKLQPLPVNFLLSTSLLHSSFNSNNSSTHQLWQSTDPSPLVAVSQCLRFSLPGHRESQPISPF